MKKTPYVNNRMVIKDYPAGEKNIFLELGLDKDSEGFNVLFIPKYPNGESSNAICSYVDNELQIKRFSTEVPLSRSTKRVQEMLDDMDHIMRDPEILDAIEDMMKTYQ